MPNIKRAVIVLLGLTALVIAGCNATSAKESSAGKTTQITLTGSQTNLQFVTAGGQSVQYPTEPLSPGDRVLGLDSIFQAGAKVGHDYETCTVGFNLEVLCQDMLTVTNQGDMLISWEFTWPASGSPPSSWQGVIAGGTGTYRGAAGDYLAILQPDQTFRIKITLDR